MKCFLIATVSLFLICAGYSAEKNNPAGKLLGEELILHINFDDGKGVPLLMEGEITQKVSKKKLKFSDRGIFGKALIGGNCTYLTEFENLDFGKDGTLVYWIALMSNDPALDAKSISAISLGPSTPAWLLFQRQGWKKSCNLMAVMYIPKKRGPLTRVFGISKTTQWKIAEWHMVTVSWTASSLSIAIDDGTKNSLTPLLSPLPVLYGDPTGVIKKLNVGIPDHTLAVDEIMIFNKKLSPEEIKKLYEESVKNAGGIQK